MPKAERCKVNGPNAVKWMDQTFEIWTKTSGYQTLFDNRTVWELNCIFKNAESRMSGFRMFTVLFSTGSYLSSRLWSFCRVGHIRRDHHEQVLPGRELVPESSRFVENIPPIHFDFQQRNHHRRRNVRKLVRSENWFLKFQCHIL